MRYFSVFSGVGGFELGIEKAYEDHCAGERIQKRGSGGNDSRPSRDKPDVLNREARRDSEHPMCIDYGETYDNISKSKVQNERPDGGLLPDHRINPLQGNDLCGSATCVGHSEIDKYASAVLRYRYPNVKNYGDITKIDWSAVPDFDLLVGGSPCQSFSVAGKRAGFDGASGLFWEYLRVLKDKKPAHFIWENVKGVLSSNGGRDFAAIVDAFSEAGYALWWQVLNAKDFGVPQNRERVFVVGTRNGSPREVFFEPRVNRDPDERDSKRTQSDALTTRCGSRNSRGTHIAEPRIRRLLPIECERLMSWPDDWTKLGDFDGEVKEISDSQRYRQCGNGVVSKVVSEVVKVHLL